MTFVPRAQAAHHQTRQPAFSVRLIDRRTGAAHRVNGTPLVIFTRNPDEAEQDLLDGRDRSVWEVRVERLGGVGRR